MAQISLNWERIRFPADGNVTAWKDLVRIARKEENKDLERRLRSKHAVYLIRVSRPFAFKYPNDCSPVVYIGKGDSQQRLRSHLGAWVFELGNHIKDLEISIFISEPKIQRSGYICEEVEADLLFKFRERFGKNPLNNIQKPTKHGKHTYSKDDLRTLLLGQGRGYHWALTPIGANPLAKRMKSWG